MAKLGRNEPCHCGSGKKYKKCCLSKDDGEARAAHAAAEEERIKAAAEREPAEDVPATDKEKTAAASLLGEKPSDATISDLVWALVLQPEFQLLY